MFSFQKAKNKNETEKVEGDSDCKTKENTVTHLEELLARNKVAQVLNMAKWVGGRGQGDGGLIVKITVSRVKAGSVVLLCLSCREQAGPWDLPWES